MTTSICYYSIYSVLSDAHSTGASATMPKPEIQCQNNPHNYFISEFYCHTSATEQHNDDDDDEQAIEVHIQFSFCQFIFVFITFKWQSPMKSSHNYRQTASEYL